MINADRILKEMLITEKATELSSHLNQYTFVVHPDANRIAVGRAIEHTFKVKVARVNIMNVKPKTKTNRMRKGRPGKKPGMKKAIVTLKAGEKIEIV